MKNSDYKSNLALDTVIFFLAQCFEIKPDCLFSISLDFLRTIAAFLVLLGHTRNLLLVDYQNVERASSPLKALYFISGYGNQSVMVFFVLSGLLIGNSVFRSFKNFNFSWKGYVLSRLTRLWIVLIPALCIGGLIDMFGSQLQPPEQSLYWQSNSTNIFQFPIQNLLNLKIFFGNLFFLQDIWLPTYGSNSSLWSLSHEFWYYIFLPALLMIIFSVGKIRYFYCFILVAIIGIGKLYHDPGLLVWLMGVTINVIPSLQQLGLHSKLMSMLVFLTGASALIGLLISRVTTIPNYNLFIGFLVSLFLWSLKDNNQNINPIFKDICHKCASFSYSLYVCHLPLLLLLCSFLSFPKRLQPNFPNLVLLTLLLFVVLLYAYGFAQLTERHTSLIRKRLSTLMGLA